jgi:hypothetical protein
MLHGEKYGQATKQLDDTLTYLPAGRYTISCTSVSGTATPSEGDTVDAYSQLYLYRILNESTPTIKTL